MLRCTRPKGIRLPCISRAALLYMLLIPTQLQAQTPFEASLVAQQIQGTQPFHYPVTPEQIGLSGALRPPRGATLLREAKLTPGHYAMIWLPALSRVDFVLEKRSALPKVLKLSAPEQLQGIAAFVELTPERRSPGRYRLFNQDPQGRAFLIGSETAGAKLQIFNGQGRLPDRAWEQSWRRLWSSPALQKVLPPAWFDQQDQHPLRLHQLSRQRGIAELETLYPQSGHFARALRRLYLLEFGARLRPAGAEQRVQWLVGGIADEAQGEPFAPRQTLHLELHGPLTLEIWARHSSSEALPPQELHPENRIEILQSDRELGRLRLPARRPDARAAFRRERVLVPPGPHKIRIKNGVSPSELAVRSLQPARRLSAHRAGATWTQALHDAQSAIDALAPTDESLKALLARLLGRWQKQAANPASATVKQICQRETPWLCALYALEESRLRSRRQSTASSALEQACEGLKASGWTLRDHRLAQQFTLAKLAEALEDIGDRDKARECLASPPAIVSSDFLAQQLRLSAPSTVAGIDLPTQSAYQWLLQRPQDKRLRSAFWPRWREQSSWSRLPPERDQQSTSYRWFARLPPHKSAKPATQKWSALRPNQSYKLASFESTDPAQDYRVMRIALASSSLLHEDQPKKARITLGDYNETIELSTAPRVLSWLRSSSALSLQVQSDAPLELFVDQPLIQSPESKVERILNQQMWPAKIGSKAQAVSIPLAYRQSPLRLDLRVAIQNPPSQRQILALRLVDDSGEPTRIWLHYDPREKDPALDLNGFGPSTFPISIDLGPPAENGAYRLDYSSTKAQVALALKVRAARLAPPPLPAPPPPPQGPIRYAQGAQGLSQRIERAHQFLLDGAFSNLRDELEWILQWPARDLRKYSEQLRSLREALRSYASRYTLHPSPHAKGSPPAVLRTPFLDPLPREGATSSRPLQASASKLQQDDFRSMVRAVDEIAQQSRLPSSSKQHPRSIALGYGVLHKVSSQLQGPAISAWLNKSARTSRWRPIEYASRSAGHEILRVERAPPMQTASSTQTLAPLPWGRDHRSVELRNNHRLSFGLDRRDPSRLRIQSYCMAKVPQALSGQSTIELRINRQRRHSWTIKNQQSASQDIVLPAGAQALRLEAKIAPDSRCFLLIQEKKPEAGEYQSIELASSQRWFTATPKRSVVLKAKGPGTIRAQIRALLENGASSEYGIEVRGPDGDRIVERGELSPERDPLAKIERASTLALSEARESLLLMPKAGLYRFEFQSPAGELFVRASTREKSEAPDSTPAPHPAGLALALDAALLTRQREPIMDLRPSPLSFQELRRRHESSLSKKRSGLWSVGGEAGLHADADHEELRSRWLTQSAARWTRALLPERLWSSVDFGLSSQDRIRPAGRLRSHFYFSSRNAAIRSQLSAHGAVQRLNLWSSAWGASARVQLSLASLLKGPRNWDWRPELRLSYRGLSANTEQVSIGPYAIALHSWIYRRYRQNHPYALAPRMELIWRGFYDLRVALGQDLWLNSDFGSVDRVRLWLRGWGLIDRYNPATRLKFLYQGGFRFTQALKDTHRSQAFSRYELSGGLTLMWHDAARRRWDLRIEDTLFLQSRAAVRNRVMLGLTLYFEKGDAVTHRPRVLRRFPHETQSRWWNEASARSIQRKEAKHVVGSSPDLH